MTSQAAVGTFLERMRLPRVRLGLINGRSRWRRLVLPTLRLLARRNPGGFGAVVRLSHPARQRSHVAFRALLGRSAPWVPPEVLDSMRAVQSTSADAVRDTIARLTDVDVLLAYARFFVMHGRHSLALVVREAALGCALHQPARTTQELIHAVSARLETNEEYVVAPDLEDSTWPDALRRRLAMTIAVTRGGPPSALRHVIIAPELKALVGGRSVALVGPGGSETDVGEAIDMHDVVVRIKDVSADPSLARDRGSRTDICVTNRFSNIGLLSKKRSQSRPLIMTTNPSTAVDLGYDVVAIPRCPLLFGSEPSIAPRCLANLLLHGASHVELFHLDLYLGSKPLEFRLRHKQLQAGRAGTFSRARSCLHQSSHDLFAQHLFLARLQKLGRVSARPQLSSVLNLTLAGYAKEMEARYRW